MYSAENEELAEKKNSLADTTHEDPSSPLRIILDKKKAIYDPGETITGRVILNLGSPQTVTQVTVNVLGTARITWAIPKENEMRQLSDPHASNETYIDETVVLLGGGFTKPKEFGIGIYYYPFDFTLPLGPIPGTFIDAFGSITYVMKGRAEFTGTNLTNYYECITAFIVKGIYNLNDDPYLAHNAELYDRKALTYCCLRFGEADILVKFQHRGYLVGDKVQWQATIGNDSSLKIHGVSATLLQQILYHAGKESKYDEKALVTVRTGVVEKKKREIWEGFLNIPKETPPTTLGGGRLIMMNYAVEFRLHLNGAMQDLKTQIPISIGTIALDPTIVVGSEMSIRLQQYGKLAKSSTGTATKPISA